ncbi:hypothetical protein F230042K4_24700 [Mediterraneibacter glycyrrhizinilyticus]|uniref:alpha-L-rhamnosidase-related protein n=1 Tax=Mediterraneibacter glycyrrhizinilyticus TaxID=342942 RepID=UPI0036F22D2B
METYEFKQARAVWIKTEENKAVYNQFAGFYTELNVKKAERITIEVAARSYYRLYINGSICADGPARTSKGYCRVDEIMKEITAEETGKITVALEVLAIDKPEKYSNDCTLEPGMLVVEICGEDGRVLSATGTKAWRGKNLKYRRLLVETMSHSRGITEWYDLNEKSRSWIAGQPGELQDMEETVHVKDEPVYLKRRAPYPTYRVHMFDGLQRVTDRKTAPEIDPGMVITLSKMMNREWYGQIPEENYFLEAVCKEKDAPFTGIYRREKKKKEYQKDVMTTEASSGENDFSMVWSRRESELGFIEFTVNTESTCVIDMVNSDHVTLKGEVKGNTYVTRYCLEKGTYHLTTMEPKLTRYVKLIFRTNGKVKVEDPKILEYTYPDENTGWFECDDGDLNRIYDASRKTLRLNTLDIFMDCPQRERGGWLCDSQFTSYGAWQMFGDLSVEKDFIENFMLTDPDEMEHAFFPEVYPGSKKDPGDPGIENWSFWLITELADYYDRSGDNSFVEACRGRVSRFIEGVLSRRGESGLLEGLNTLFVDWSLSNRDFCLKPISIPNNCLAVHMLEQAYWLYGVEEWKKAAGEMREIIEKLDEMPGIFGGGGDGAVYQNGQLRRTDCATESGAALELWSGFHKNDRRYIRRFVDSMGYSPRFRPDPNVGRSNLFIGLMIRFSVLAKMGEIDALVREMKDLYLSEMRIGSGTLFENYSGFSGCHGFNAAAGAFLTNYVLGLGEPKQRTKTIRISPNPRNLFWAAGRARCEDGEITMNWNADHVTHELEINLQMPKGWKAEYHIPFALTAWKIRVNGEQLKK